MARGDNARFWIGLPLLAWGLACVPPVQGGASPQATAPPSAGTGTDTGTIEFDLPAQALQAGLERYSEITGRSVIYQGALAQGRTGSPVRGRLTAEAALDRLLQGTGLVARYTGPEHVVLMPASAPPPASMPAAVPMPAAHRAYFGAAQADLRRTFCEEPMIAPGDYRAAFALRVDAGGRVREARLLDSTGDAARDAALVGTLSEMTFGAPPADMPQPFVLLILPGAKGRANDCPDDRAASSIDVEEPGHGRTHG